jgi:hypothetical protein
VPATAAARADSRSGKQQQQYATGSQHQPAQTGNQAHRIGQICHQA